MPARPAPLSPPAPGPHLALRRFPALLAGVATMLLAACDGSPSAAAGDADADEGSAWRPPVAVVEIQPRDLSRRLALSATVQPRVAVRLASRTAGTVRAVHVEAGDRVEAGALLAELDTAEQQAELARAQARADEAASAYARAREMRARQLLSEADYQAAQAQRAVAEGDRQLWRTRVEFGRILAPADGTIIARLIELGEAVESQQMLFEMADLEDLVLPLGVSELDVVHLDVGDTIPVSFDALPELELDAVIRRIFPSADSESRLVTVELALPGEAWQLGVRPGYLARLRTLIDRQVGVLAVPSAAIGQRDGDDYVYVIEEETLVHRSVRPGLSRGDWVEITRGLEAGDLVLAASPTEMRDGQRVRISRRLDTQ